MVHGFPKLMGGPPTWTRLGQSMANFGIYQFPDYWGFMAAFAEFGGGILVLTGLLSRAACLLLLMNMTVAITKHLMAGDSIDTTSHAIEAFSCFLLMLLTGPGKYSLDHFLFNKKPKQAAP